MKALRIAGAHGSVNPMMRLKRRKPIVLLAALHIGLAFVFLASKSPYQVSGEDRIGYPFPYKFIESRAGAEQTSWFPLLLVLDLFVSAICGSIVTVPVLASMRIAAGNIAGRQAAPAEPFGPVECGLIGLIAAFLWAATDFVLYVVTEADHPERLRILGLICRDGAIHAAVLVATGALVGMVVERSFSRPCA